MAIRHESDSDDNRNLGQPDPPAIEGVPNTDTPTPSLNDPGGSTETSKGERRSCRNAIKHGVFSKCPLIGDEREDDLNEMAAGMRESLQPGNWNEELSVDQLIQNRRQRIRAELWMNKKLKLQRKGVDHWNRQTMDPNMMDLPEDEAAWLHSDPWAAYKTALLLREGPSDRVLTSAEAAPYIMAFERTTSMKHPRSWLPGGDEFPDTDSVALNQVLEGVDLAAKSIGAPRGLVLAQIEDEIRSAIAHRVMRLNDDRRRRKVDLVDALALSESDFARYERWVNHLDKEYERLMKRLELAQRARGGALPPPIRLHRSDD
jgi:hypothetical protein